MNVEEEVDRLKEEIKRLGDPQQDGSYKVKFGVLFNDDRCANIFEALVGTLRAAKKRKIVAYEGSSNCYDDIWKLILDQVNLKDEFQRLCNELVDNKERE